MPALDELNEVYEKAIIDPEFTAELRRLAAEYTGRPSLLSEAPRFSQLAGGARILLKREDLNHTGSRQDQQRPRPGAADQAHGQDARDRRDQGAGQHGVATATAAGRAVRD